MNGDLWFKIRMGVMAAGFVIGLIASGALPVDELRELPTPMLGVLTAVVIIGLALMPVMLIAVVGVQAINPASDERWDVPSHRSNPFRLGNPLTFFHFIGCTIAVASLGFIVSGIWNGLYAVIYGVLLLIGSAMVLLGVRLCTRIFKHKIR